MSEITDIEQLERSADREINNLSGEVGRLRKQLATANARVTELEGLLTRAYYNYPCEHDTESDPADNPGCDYCSLFVEMKEALQKDQPEDVIE